ncbi:tissue factor pathway inhibitor-like [Myripristis murdjan]|uniref:tissue factor pathway inhibitor-like n=1 Tax=Myripristis murdjan TaxID=586833 RepID=UPI001175CE6B|nr:tissue factor pathway inhibitor-like [Myripristis murdjan]
MRQLKGKPKKETSKDKKERKQAMQEARQQVATVVLPTLAVVVLLIVVFVYVATRPDPACLEQMDGGSGDGQTLMYFYNKDGDQCQPFFYKGQEGNGNRFSTDKECIQTCSPRFTELYPEGSELCMLPLDHGSCFGMLLMYYYNAEEGNCRTFHYTGCQGNGNRFGTREECQKTCMARSGRLGGPAGTETNPDEVTTSAGLIVGIVGGVIFAVSLIIATVYFVKER